MELRHLRYFVVLAQEENFHRAAQRLHVSQSPLSRQMQALQAEIGAALLEPHGRGVRLTPAGRLFAQRAEAILAASDAAVAEARLMGQGRIGTIPIGFETGTAYFGTLAAIVTTARRREPRITLDLTPMSSAEQWEALQSGTIALGYGHYPPDDPDLAWREISRARIGVVLAGDHRLAARPELALEDLRGEPVLLQPRRHYPRLHDDLIAAVRARGLVLDVLAEIADLEAILALVAGGDAVTFLPENQIPILLLGTAVWKPVTDLDVHRADIVMWRRQDERSPLLRPLIDIVREVAGGYAARDQPGTSDGSRSGGPT
ncbi:transcriptional regulator [Actinoplanes sp. NBRC 14428]|nr:transcriptional regulator [Actinoplanes sp. NBRC 14428]